MKPFWEKKNEIEFDLPCYNVAQYLPKCLDSIFENECFGVEVVLINDGSSDDIGGAKQVFQSK